MLIIVFVNITFNVTASAGSSFMINLTSFIYYDNNSVPTSLSVGKKSVVYNVIGECNLNIDCDAKSYCEADHRCVSIAGSGQQIQGSGYGEDGYYNDADGDGVTGTADLCPSIGTPATVSSNGCLYGDTNIDGCVNFDDVSVIAQNVDFDCPSENHAAGQSGRAGDVTNDGCVNFDDISKIALNVNFDCISN